MFSMQRRFADGDGRSMRRCNWQSSYLIDNPKRIFGGAESTSGDPI